MRALTILATPILVLAVANAQVKTWTTTADFNEGTYFNTNATAVQGELRLNAFGSAPVPFVNIPVGGRELAARGWNYSPGRIVRVNTQTGQVAGEYALSPDAFETAPSRAVVDSQGNVWVTTRYEGSGVYGVTKIGVLIGGTRYYKLAEGVYVPYPLGEYVKDPVYTTGVDRDGDGYIRTSAGLGNLLPWPGTTGKDLDSSLPFDAPGTVQEAADELILVFKRMPGNGASTRAVAIDENDNCWAGNDEAGHAAWQLAAADGKVLKKIPMPGMTYVYTMFYQSGFLWVSGYTAMRKVETSTGVVTTVSGTPATNVSVVTPYDSARILAASAVNHAGSELVVIDRATASVSAQFPTPGSIDLRGIAVDRRGHMWVCSRGLWAGGDQRVYHLDGTGALVGTFYTGDRPCGIGLDSNGFLWVTHIGNPNNGNGAWTTVIDPEGNNGVGIIVGYVGIGTGSYNYSDGTGATTSQITGTGEWRVVLDSFRPELHWGRLTWDAVVPAQTSLEIYARAAETRIGLLTEQFVKATGSNFDFYGLLRGRYVEIRVRLGRDDGVPGSVTPQLRSLTMRYADGTISGTVGLGEYNFDGPDQTADFALVAAGGGSPTLVNDVKLGPFGAFAFVVSERGSYNLWAKSPHWLRQKLPYSINITNDGSHNNPFALINGDADGDNAVTLLDYDIFSEHFDKTSNDADWNTPGISGFTPAQADLDGSYAVDLLDFDIFSNHFDTLGDEY